MPGSSDILKQLSFLSQSYLWLAVLWHLAIYSVLIRKGWRPKQRHAAQILFLPLLSVSTLAWFHGNPFNGLMFLALILILGIISFRLANRPVSLYRKWTFPVGICALLYSLFYPHFLEGYSPLIYAVAAPVGIVPCPTLSLVLGFTLLFHGFHSRLWQAVCAAAGLFYAIFGIFILGVALDFGLLLFSASVLALMSEHQELDFPHGKALHS